MAEVLTSSPSITLLSGLPNCLDQRLFREALFRFRSASFSQATTGTSWNEKNFERRLRHFNDRLAILICELKGTRILIGERDSIEVTAFFDLVSRSQARFVILFWGDERPEFLNLVSPSNVLLLTSAPADGVIFYAILAELLSLGWGGLSLRANPVRLSALIEIAERLFELCFVASGVKIDLISAARTEQLAWISESVFSQKIDFEKFLNDSRDEQKSDALKRMLDIETSRVSYNSSLRQRRSRIQALFWLLEVGESFEPGILRLTGTFRLISGGEDFLVESARAAIHCKPGIDTRRLEKFASSFVRIPSGKYRIGENSDEALSEPPSNPRLLCVPSFKILNRPITYEDWWLFCESLPAWRDKDFDPLLPVVNVNIAEAAVFAQKVTEILVDACLLPLSSSVELPTEEYWEIAARGPSAWQYPWGDKFDRTRCNADQALGETSRVFSFSPAGDSIFGCSDMAGNVREWTNAKVAPSSFWRDEVIAERGSVEKLSSVDRYVIRGGSYSYDGDCVRSWVRNTQIAGRRDPQTGFRLVILSE